MLKPILNPVRVSRFVVMLALIAGSSTWREAPAQSAGSGRISGTVHREDGEKTPAAIVVISNLDRRVQRTTKANAQGAFTFSGLPAGSYVIQGCSEQFGPSITAN